MGRQRTLSITYFVRISLCVALTVVLSWIAIPFTPPLTLQLLAISLTLFLLGGLAGIITVTVYLLMGAIGLPVFSGFVGGIGHIASATGGYLFGFLLYCVTYAALSRIFGGEGRRRLIYSALGLLILYLTGSVWYNAVYISAGISGYLTSLITTVVPFILPDILKIAVAYTVSGRLSAALGLRSKTNKRGFENGKGKD